MCILISKVHSKLGSRGRVTRPKDGSDDEACDVQEMSAEVTTVEQGVADQTASTVNIGQLGNQAEVQLAEALVAVSEGLVMTPQVVAVEETGSQEAEVSHVVGRGGDEPLFVSPLKRIGCGVIL